MNYYIKGDAANADKIKAAFKKLGYETATDGWNFNANCGVYFTNEADKSVDYTHIETFVNIIKTHPDYKELELPKPHYDIANFHAGMPVLVRPDNDCCWDYSVFSRNTGNEYWPFAVCNGVSFTQCIPFNEDTKHLLGTTDMCDEMYINW